MIKSLQSYNIIWMLKINQKLVYENKFSIVLKKLTEMIVTSSNGV